MLQLLRHRRVRVPGVVVTLLEEESAKQLALERRLWPEQWWRYYISKSLILTADYSYLLRGDCSFALDHCSYAISAHRRPRMRHALWWHYDCPGSGSDAWWRIPECRTTVWCCASGPTLSALFPVSCPRSSTATTVTVCGKWSMLCLFVCSLVCVSVVFTVEQWVGNDY